MEGGMWRPRPGAAATAAAAPQDLAEREQARARLRDDLTQRRIEGRLVEIEVRDTRTPTLSVMGPQGNETMGIDAQALQEIWGRQPGNRTKVRKLQVGEARKLLHDEEAQKLLLSVVEGCAVYTRYGHVRTDHVLFLAAGAFHFHKPSELIPELQGRFPVRVALQSLTEADFVRILSEPKNALVRQYVALFRTEDVDLSFTPDGIRRLAAIAWKANKSTQDIGARRLMTILEKCLEDLSYEASERRGLFFCACAGSCFFFFIICFFSHGSAKPATTRI
jgi:ATP-dependent HslUV protease ATP-binding subunit HslU